MRRYKYDSLLKWKNRPNHKPLILWGARQTGKTWLMKHFGAQEYDNTVYISFYNNKRIGSIFETDYNPNRIIKDIEIALRVRINPSNTLLIFDEVQSAPKVVESLKYFCEDMPELDIITAGSLLGVALHEGISFPVGKVDELRLYPLSFSEFVEALGEGALIELFQAPERANTFSYKFEELLKLYYIVGGMPEVVSSYIEEQDFYRVREIQLNILNQYEGDFGKHINNTELPRTKMVWNSIPLQLAKENKKFFFGQIKKGARSKDFELSIEWLKSAGLVYQVHKVSSPSIPLKAYIDFTAFKLYFIDVGLLCALSELDLYSVLYGSDIFTEFKGALTEQFVLQEMICGQKYTPYYYSGTNSTYETDFLIQKEGSILPLEVKAGVNLNSKSLRFFMEKYRPKEAYKISLQPYADQGSIKNIPLWMAGDILSK